jgi:hypothetical protein
VSLLPDSGIDDVVRPDPEGPALVPEALPRLMSGGDPAHGQRVQNALMGMQKIVVAELEAAAAGAAH